LEAIRQNPPGALNRGKGSIQTPLDTSSIPAALPKPLDESPVSLSHEEPSSLVSSGLSDVSTLPAGILGILFSNPHVLEQFLFE
jgi:hypothetical protein